MVDLRPPIYERIRDSKRKQILGKRHRAALSKIGSAFPSLLSDIGFEDDSTQPSAQESYNPLLGVQEYPDQQQNSQNTARNHILCQLVTHSESLILEEETLERQHLNKIRLQSDYEKNPLLPGLATKLDRVSENIIARSQKITEMRKELLDLVYQDESLETGPEPRPTALIYRRFFRQAAQEGLLKLAETLPDHPDQDSPGFIEKNHVQNQHYTSQTGEKRGENLNFFSQTPAKLS